MIKPLRLTVLTPAETLLEAAGVRWVQIQLADGSGISIWPGHAPLLGETITAPLRYANGEGEHVLDLEAGILQVDHDGVTVFTSGLVQASQGLDPVEGSGAAKGEARFDQLARTLLTALEEQPAEEADLASDLSGAEEKAAGSGKGGKDE
ncbi:MAG: hypothetical protein SVX38_04830 [Chloroflexota bacterium]|nr:hypothetical protein [Chloroflexota bacterium]